MLHTFTDYIRQQHLVSEDDKVLLAVSGGRDSVAMAHLFSLTHHNFAIAHCNFQLRPGACDIEQAHVKDLAQSLHVPFHTVVFPTRQYASDNHLSIEEAARDLRYNYFGSLCQTHGYTCVATAHHKDDSCETFFLNLFRGTGISGLHGILPTSHHSSAHGSYRLIRPMLCFSRDEITHYIEAHNIPFDEDLTNAELDSRRNQIRHLLMPLLRELYPAIDNTMQANIQRLSEIEKIYTQHISQLRQTLTSSIIGLYGECYTLLPIAPIIESPSPNTLLFELIRPYGFNSSIVSDILNNCSTTKGKQFLSPTHTLAIDKNQFIISPSQNETSPNILFDTINATDIQSTEEIKKSAVAYLDISTFAMPCRIRRWRAADKFQPFGMHHQRLVSDFLKDLKLNPIEKQRVCVLTDNNDHILWVVGLRIDHRYRITPSTKQALKATLAPQLQ
ncbi:MAG: tRNA lysidine(34) synthetase TilS [Bacteroidales bacterium]|nr:tRNA lysidine(34) synthetase TilS [Bacteroidales bacterium]MBR1799843.1 tRNA lysidine(34) synthetase TilS [Bacteroidales bacterium]